MASAHEQEADAPLPARHREGPHIELVLDLKDPIEVGDFVAAFAALEGEFDRFVRARFPDLQSASEIYVTEVRQGSIVAELVPWIVLTGQAALTIPAGMDAMMVVEDFVRRWSTRVGAYLKPGGKTEEADKAALRDFMGAVAAVAKDRDGEARLRAVDGDRRISVEFRFGTPEARIAQEGIEAHRRTLEAAHGADHRRMLMTFVQTNTKSIGLGTRTGERVIIGDLFRRDLPLIYASALAEERIKHEIREADENVFKKGFVVDVSVALRNGRPLAYRVTELHQVIDLPDED